MLHSEKNPYWDQLNYCLDDDPTEDKILPTINNITIFSFFLQATFYAASIHFITTAKIKYSFYYFYSRAMIKIAQIVVIQVI